MAVSLVLGVGSRWEPARTAGISHFLEHIVFKGTARYPDSHAVSSAVEGLGGVLNASTEKETTTFWARVARPNIEVAVNVLTDLAFAPKIDPEEVERERLVVLEELKMYLDQPGDLVQMNFDRQLWGHHPLARDPAGTKRSVGAITAQDLASFRGAHYRPDRLVVVIAGALSPKTAVGLVERRLEPQLRSLPPSQAARSDGGVPTPGPNGPLVEVRRRRGEQLHLLLGVLCSSYLSPDRWILDLLNTILGEGMSSRLFMELRERRALAYDVHSFVTRHRDSGSFAVYLATRPDQGPNAIRAALQELARIAEEGVGAVELERAKAQFEGRLSLQLESAGALSDFLGHQELLTGQILGPEDVVERVRAVTAAELADEAGKILSRPDWRLAAVGPLRAGDELADALGR